MTTTWNEIPAGVLIKLLGERGENFHPRDIVKPNVLADKYGLPLSLLPVMEIVARDAPAGTVLFGDDGNEVAALQGVVIGKLIDAIAEGLGVEMPDDAPAGYSGSRFDLAAAIVRHVQAAATSASEMKAAEAKADRALQDAMQEYLNHHDLPDMVEAFAQEIFDRHSGDCCGGGWDDFVAIFKDLYGIGERLRSLDSGRQTDSPRASRRTDATTTVHNRSKGSPTPPPDGVYIGRDIPRARIAGSPFANPWPIVNKHDDQERANVVAKYGRWLFGDAELAAEKGPPPSLEDVRALAGKSLVCWCAPKLCHGHLLAAVADGVIGDRDELEQWIKSR